MFVFDTIEIWWAAYAPVVLLTLYFLTQALYSLSLLVDAYLFS